MLDEPTKEEAERRAKEIARRMLTTPKKKAPPRADSELKQEARLDTKRTTRVAQRRAKS